MCMDVFWNNFKLQIDKKKKKMEQYDNVTHTAPARNNPATWHALYFPTDTNICVFYSDFSLKIIKIKPQKKKKNTINVKART